MPENLVPGDVEQYTKSRLSQTDPETVRALNSALARVRRYCGWHVSPVRTETMRRDGTGHPFLVLPTLKIVNLLSIRECGELLDLDEVHPSGNAPGGLAKDGFRCWKYGFSNIEVELTHGFTAIEAEDFREAVLSLIDQAAESVGTGRHGPLISKRVDDVHYTWSGLPRAIENAPMDKSLLDKYKLPPFA